MKTNRLCLASLLVLAFGLLHAQAPQPPSPSMAGIRLEECLEGPDVVAVREFDREGRLVFEKKASILDAISIDTYAYGEDGRLRLRLSCVVQGGTLQVVEHRHGPGTVEQWMVTMKGLVASIGDDYAAQNEACSLAGFPRSREEWLAHPPLKRRLAAASFRMHAEQLDSLGQVSAAMDYDERGTQFGATTCTRDAQGRLVKKETVQRSGIVIRNEDRYGYDAEGRLVSAVHMQWQSTAWDTITADTYGYEEGRLALHRSVMGRDAEVTTYLYGADGWLERAETVFEGYGLSYERVWERDADGRPVRMARAKVGGKRERPLVLSYRYTPW